MNLPSSGCAAIFTISCGGSGGGGHTVMSTVDGDELARPLGKQQAAGSAAPRAAQSAAPTQRLHHPGAPCT